MNYHTMLTRYLLFLLFAVFTASEARAGGPWLLPQNSGFLQIQFNIAAYSYSKLLTGFGLSDSRDINREVFTTDYTIYGEYGLLDRLDVLALIPFKYASVGERTDQLAFPTLLDEGSINGLSNVRLGLKYGILDGDVKAAVSAQASLNTVSTELDKGLATGFQSNAFGLFGHVGGSFSTHWYAFAELGYMKHTNDFSDVIEGRIEVGRNFGSAITLLLTTDIRQTMQNGSYFNENLIQTGLYPNDQEWAASSLKLNYEFSDTFGANVATALIPIQFNNVGFAGAFTIGTYVKW